MARRSALLLPTALAVSAPFLLLMAAPAAATVPAQGSGSGSATVKLSSDAWYSVSTACTATPTGCVPAGAPAPPYPGKTLHVGVAAGQEEARTYLSLDLAALPAGTSLTSGLLSLPVAGTDDGSRSPDMATLQACLVAGSFKDNVEGSTEMPPKVDCKQATAPAKYIAAVGTVPARFTIDLRVFAAAWAAGTPNQGIAVLPADGTGPTSAWHVAMSAHDRAGSTVLAPTAIVQFASAAAAFDTQPFVAPADAAFQPTTGANTGSSSVAFGSAPLSPQSSIDVAAPAFGGGQPAVAPQSPPVAPTAAVQQFTPQAFSAPGGFAYPGVFLLPLLLAAGAGLLGRALTRDLAPSEQGV